MEQFLDAHPVLGGALTSSVKKPEPSQRFGFAALGRPLHPLHGGLRIARDTLARQVEKRQPDLSCREGSLRLRSAGLSRCGR